MRKLNGLPARGGDYVLYWMQQSQRAHFNHALEFAVQRANDLGLPLVVAFGLTPDYQGADSRHYRFMLEGLAGTARELGDRGIRFVLRIGDPAEVALGMAARAAAVVCDMGYLRHQRRWRERVAFEAGCEVTRVEADVVVPVETASDRPETAARTIRPRIRRHLEDHLVRLKATPLRVDSSSMRLEGLRPDDSEGLVDSLGLEGSVRPVPMFTGGTRAAKRMFKGFLKKYLPGYSQNRNRPETDHVSHMGMYLHFGQISPVYLAAAAMGEEGASAEDRDAFLEELIIRRELACNFVFFNKHHDSYACLPGWAKKTLAEHAGDKREYLYSRRELEKASTHDPYWNAAMLEMIHTGYMHNYMRMYWGKKILEWSPDPQKAFRTALYLNNRYFIDGRDPNSYAGVAWVFGVHDRPWPQRDIFGKVRYMSAGGLERKADPAAYVDKVERMVRG